MVGVAAIEQPVIHAAMRERSLCFGPFRCCCGRNENKVSAIDDGLFIGNRLVVPFDVSPFSFADGRQRFACEVMRLQNILNRTETEAKVVEPFDGWSVILRALLGRHTFGYQPAKVCDALPCWNCGPFA